MIYIYISEIKKKKNAALNAMLINNILYIYSVSYMFFFFFLSQPTFFVLWITELFIFECIDN